MLPLKRLRPLVAGAVLLLAACASASQPTAGSPAGANADVAQAGAPASSRRCAPATVDSSFATYGVVHTACTVDRPARLRTPPRYDRTETAAVTASRRPQNVCQSAEVEFVIDETGQPIAASARITRSTSVEAAKTLVRQLDTVRYEPAMKDGQPVRQVARLPYGVAAVVSSGGGGAPGRAPRC